MTTVCRNSVAITKLATSPWWTEELYNNRQRVRALRKRFQKCYCQHWRLIYRQEYKEAQALYTKLLRKTKTEYWEKYFDLTENWDEAKLKELVEKKHGKNERKMPKTDIICKYFLDALEDKEYGWVWKCPNGGNKCPDRHVLPPGFVLKKDGKSEGKTKQMSVEDLVEKQNVPCLEISSDILSTALNNVETGTIASQRHQENNQPAERETHFEEDNKDVALIDKKYINFEEGLEDLDELLNLLRGLSSEDLKNLKAFCELINFIRGLSSEDLKKLKAFCELINFIRELSSEDLKNVKDFCESLNLIQDVPQNLIPNVTF